MSIDEAARASDARLAAAIRYWEAVEESARRQPAQAREILARYQALTPEFQKDEQEVRQTRETSATRAATLGTAAKNWTELEASVKQLNAIVQGDRRSELQAQARLDSLDALVGELLDLTNISRDAELAAHSKVELLKTEAARWPEFYRARTTRAQTECSLTKIDGKPLTDASGVAGPKPAPAKPVAAPVTNTKK